MPPRDGFALAAPTKELKNSPLALISGTAIVGVWGLP